MRKGSGFRSFRVKVTRTPCFGPERHTMVTEVLGRGWEREGGVGKGEGCSKEMVQRHAASDLFLIAKLHLLQLSNKAIKL